MPGWMNLEQELQGQSLEPPYVPFYSKKLSPSEWIMAKLKQKDRRPVGKFQPGDIVLLHPKHNNIKNPGPGIVLQILKQEDEVAATPSIAYKPIVQSLALIFAPTEEELFTASRRYARKHIKDMGFIPAGTCTYFNGDVIPTKEAHPEWLAPPTKDELDMERFMDMFDDLP